MNNHFHTIAYQIEFGVWKYTGTDYPLWVVELSLERTDKEEARQMMRELSKDLANSDELLYVKMIDDGADNRPVHYISTKHPGLMEAK